MNYLIRGFVSITLMLVSARAAEPAAPDYTVKIETVMKHDDGKFLWFHPRAAAIPGALKGEPSIVMTIQKHLEVSDHYSGLHVMTRAGVDAPWIGPVLPPELDWQKQADGITIGMADVTPGYHAKTGKVIAIGCRVRYSAAGAELDDIKRAHSTVYAILDLKTGKWTPWQLLELPADDQFNFARNACAQWVVKSDGALLVPLYIGKSARDRYSTTVAECRFDGEKLTFVRNGNVLRLAAGRGLYEPSLIEFGGRFYLTLRNDARGYVSVSDDGLNFAEPKAWTFDDGKELGSYNTQQHWLAHGDGLYLVYTRRGANNDHIMRHRAPLFMGRVDPAMLHVMRATEKVIVPERGAELGNFGACAINETESWVTVSEGMFMKDSRARGAEGATFVARILWSKPKSAKASAKPRVTPVKQQIPAEILDPAAWSIGAGKTGILEPGKLDGQAVISVAGAPVNFVSTAARTADTLITMRFRMAAESARPATMTLTAGLKDGADVKDRGLYVTLAGQSDSIRWSVFDPNSTVARTPTVSGFYRPHFSVERSLSWPESLRKIVEADTVASAPLNKRWLTLKLLLRKDGYEAFLDGIPLAHPMREGLETGGFLRLTVSPGIQVAAVQITNAQPAEAGLVYQPLSIQSILNSARIDGQEIDHASFPGNGNINVGGLPFMIAEPDATGNDHVDVGASWFRQGGLDGRFSGRGADAIAGRWVGALIKDPARLTLRIPMARYRALHLIAATDSEADSVPVVTAQFYRVNSGFPKNFAARVPAFRATSSDAEALPVKTRDGGKGTLYRVTIPIDPGALAEFDDMDFVELELTKQVQIYRASPDPIFYSHHAAGLPSSVHIYAITAERPTLDVSLQADAVSHVWVAPQTPNYSVTLRNRSGAARQVQLELATTSLDGKSVTSQKQSVALPADKLVTLVLPLKLAAHGYHDLKLTVVDGSQTWNETRSLAWLHEDTRSRGDWDFGRGPLFGFWNWGGGHNTPPAEQQLLVMAKAGIESTPGSYEQYVSRHGEKTQKVMEDYKIFTMKFAGAGDHYITGRFSANLKSEGLEKARVTFLADLAKAQSKAGPYSRPLFLSFYPEPSLGPITHGLWPDYYGEPEYQLSAGEKVRYETFLNGFVEGAKIVKENYPGVKCLLPHGDPMFAAHFLRGSAEARKLIDGVTVDIPFFERLPEQQMHQVSLHRLYMVRNEFKKAGIPDPLLPMYEGPCIPSGPGALTDQEQADLSIRDSLMLMVYGVNIQNGGFPAYDTASYWGEQHYGFGVLNRVALETPKPAYAALATLTRHLNRANFNKWVPTGSLTTFALQYKHYKTGKLIHVMWTLRGKRPITLSLKDGAAISVFSQMDNEEKLVSREGKVSFTLDQSPCYVEGLSEDAVIALGESDHSDSKPSANVAKLANFGDGAWQFSSQREPGYEGSHVPYIVRFQSRMTVKPVDAPAAQGGKALAIHLEKPEKDRIVVPFYSVLVPKKPIVIAGKASHLGLWVKGASDWGRVIYFLRDAKGEQWISVGTRGAWNCDDLHSWSSFNFDGWRYLRFELPANTPYDSYREAGSTWWGTYSSGDSIVDLPLTLEKIAVERRTHVLYVNDPQPVRNDDPLLGDLFAEYATPQDATPEALRLAALRMPMPTEVKGLENPIRQMLAEGVAAPIKIQKITLPEQEADGTRCFVHFDPVAGAKQYDIWASPYPDGTGALRLGKDWKTPGQQIRGLRPNQDFYLFVLYTDAEGKKSRPSAPFKINLDDFFAMK